MDMRTLCFSLLYFAPLLCSGALLKESEGLLPSSLMPRNRIAREGSQRVLSSEANFHEMPQLDLTTPVATVPVINPTNPMYPSNDPFSPMTLTTPTTNPVVNPGFTPATATPTMNPVANPGFTPATSSGQSWCVASQTASQTALQVALDYACGYGGADCSAIQSGAKCFNPNTVRDHASYAFNYYYQKNPAPTSCDFGGTAVITNTDPSTSTCQYPSSSVSSSVPTTTNPTNSNGPAIYGGGGSTPPYGINNTDAAPTRLTNLVLTFLALSISLLVCK